jgi:hypothetical protein
MAFRSGAADLWPMYSFNASNRTVRDLRATYPDRAPDPERFPAELVLRDLCRSLPDGAVPLIVARYAALRAWLLRGAAPEPAFREQARAAATAHLDAADRDWTEGRLLRRLLEPGRPGDPGAEPWELLAQVASAAEAAGHLDGALAARTAAWRAAMDRHRASPTDRA